jgi:hypothetical protein
MPIPLNAAAILGRPSEYTIARSIWHHGRVSPPYRFAFQGWSIACTMRTAFGLTEGPDEPWQAIAGVHLTTSRRLVTVAELSREGQERQARPLVLAAEIHAGWPGAKSWLETAASAIPNVEFLPDLKIALESALAEAVERVDEWIRSVSQRNPLP